MDARAILAKLRQGVTPTEPELIWFAHGLADQSVSAAQAGAFAMGVCRHGLGQAGRVALTRAMQQSGETLTWGLDAPVLDKHSTGGVGDCVSLLLAPALAGCGVYVPMISGRGLGHTGGTLDKLEAIPGLKTTLDQTQFRAVVAKAGCAIVSASANIAPADKRLYAVRDVTATVESLDLITASILSKKLAAGVAGLVLDVKVGSGAFMKDLEEARALAHALVDTANAAGCPTSAVITDMSQPAVPSIGNALEVLEIVRLLTGAATGPLLELSAVLGGVLLTSAGLAKDVDAGAARVLEAVANGQAAERFQTMVTAMGGPVGFVANPARYLPEATVIREVTTNAGGYVTAIDGEALGLAVVALGGGRQIESDVIDPAVGLSDIVRLGTRLRAGQVLARVHAGREDGARAAMRAVRDAIELSDHPGQIPPLFHDRIG